MKFFAIGLACALISTIESLKTHQSLKYPAEHQIYHQEEDAWENQDPDFDCDKAELYCWQDWLRSKYNNCNQYDFDCFQKTTDQFTCKLEDPECWEQRIDQFNCDPDDDDCLSYLLPRRYPCQFVQGCRRN